ncbi:hypothetical protein PZB74_12515 [Porifericola rhodea]|uniref:hypothetical protein n=1 Tax=Porifericola rhodea TaxID=930972 RepID=UPI002665A68A|nr:hypothetical protein [Porifericola rhodea]WKN29789.1 hypothetical protein PZB74_12515 [Porifericola rhodea]
MLKKLIKKLSTLLSIGLQKQTKALSEQIGTVSAIEQINIGLSYNLLNQNNAAPSPFNSHGFKVYSQHEEDGLIWYIFSLIGATNKQCVEVCAGNGVECNSANLIVNHGWLGLLFDGDAANVKSARQFFHNHPSTRYWPPTIKHAWITKNNINQLILDERVEGEIDLLSLDIDGIDYWLWKELTVVKPRLVVLEFNHLLGPERSVTVPYREDFKAEFTEWGSDYAGASLNAFCKLAKKKGYRLIGTNRYATNAFFLREDIQHKWLPEVQPKDCFQHPRAIFGIEKRFPLIKDKTWIEV